MAKLDINLIKQKSIKILEPDLSYIDNKYLIDFRKKLNISRALLASFLGVSEQSIKNWEQEKSKINASVTRLIYLFEKNPNNLVLLKEVIIVDEVIGW